MPRLNAAALAVIGILLVQFATVRFVMRGAVLPPAPALREFPLSIDAWQSYGELTQSDAIAAQLHADRFLERSYFNAGDRRWLDFLVAWFQTQRGGAQQPHSPKVCLPGSGWMAVANAVITVNTAAGPLSVNRYTAVNRDRTEEVLYWYQTSNRTITSEWAAKLYLVVDGVRTGRTDTALVRVSVAGGSIDDAVRFIRAAYPRLRQTLPQ